MTAEQITTIIITAILTLIFGTGGLGLLLKLWLDHSVKKHTVQKEQQTKAKEQQEYEQKALKSLTLELSSAKLEQDHRYFINRGYIEPHELRRLEKIYHRGKDLGLNGASETLFNGVKNLPTTKPKENQ